LEQYTHQRLSGLQRPHGPSSDDGEPEPLYYGSKVAALPAQLQTSFSSSPPSSHPRPRKRARLHARTYGDDDEAEEQSLSSEPDDISSPDEALTDHDMPDNLLDFMLLAGKAPASVFEWVQTAKARLAQASEKQY